MLKVLFKRLQTILFRHHPVATGESPFTYYIIECTLGRPPLHSDLVDGLQRYGCSLLAGYGQRPSARL